MKTAVVHDWLTTWAGSERVLEAIVECVPNAEIFTLVNTLRGEEREHLGDISINTSLLQRIPAVGRLYRYLLPLMPLCVEQFDLSDFELIVSSSHAVAKGVLKRPEQLHICYCHTPIRYAWDLYHQYMDSVATPLKPIAALFLHYIRLWDLSTAVRVDHFVANSKYVARRIRNVYRRRAKVIYPPVDVGSFEFNPNRREDFYVCVSRHVPYKKLELIVRAFAKIPKRKVYLIGEGTHKLDGAYPNVRGLGTLRKEDMKRYLREAKAFVYAAEEDFGISMVEAMACGTPVVAFGRGGAVEIVEEGKSGVLFKEQTPSALLEALERFEALEGNLDRHYIRAKAESFSKERFIREFTEFIREKMDKHRRRQEKGTV